VIAWIALSLRRLRDERGTALGLAGLVLVTTLVATAAPRLLDRVADEALQSEVAALTPAARAIQLLREDIQVPVPPSTEAPLEQVTAVGETLFESMPAEIRDIVGDRAVVIDSGRWEVARPTRDPSFVRFRIQPGAADRVRLVSGRLPVGAAEDLGSRAAFEVALSEQTAAALDARIGDRIPLEQDPTDTLVGRFDGIGEADAVVVGIYAVADPDDPWWLCDQTLNRPVVRGRGGDDFVLDMGGLLGPQAWPLLLATAGTDQAPFRIAMRYTFREYVDATRLRERELLRLIPAFRKLEATYPSANVLRGVGNTALRAGLRPFFEAHVARWAAATAVLTVAAVGPVAVAAAALALLSVTAGCELVAGLRTRTRATASGTLSFACFW